MDTHWGGGSINHKCVLKEVRNSFYSSFDGSHIPGEEQGIYINTQPLVEGSVVIRRSGISGL